MTSKTDHTVEEIPTIDPGQSDSEEVAVFVHTAEPTDEDLLTLYEIYREAGGEAYEPYESMRAKRLTAGGAT